MALTSEAYLPDLGKCLDGSTILLSWEDVLRALLSHQYEHVPAITAFFRDPHVPKLLSPFIPSFSRPTSATRSQFETRTAAINITPSTHGLYDIEEMKADALWLSSEVQLDEVESIRLAVLEWQYRPRLRLEAGFSEAELANLKDALGPDLAALTRGTDPRVLQRSESIFETQDARRSRLLRLHADENAAMYHVSKELQQAHHLNDLLPEAQMTSTLRAAMSAVSEDSSSRLQKVGQLLAGLKARISRLDGTTIGLRSEGNGAAVDYILVESTLNETLVLLQKLLMELRKSAEAVTSTEMNLWHGYTPDLIKVEQVAPQSPELAVIAQKALSTAMVVWIAILDPASCIAHFAQVINPDGTERPDVNATAYYLDAESIADIHRSMYEAAQSGNIIAAPVVLGWALMVDSLRKAAAFVKDTQESQHVQKVIDTGSGQDAASRRSSAGLGDPLQQSVYETLLDKIKSVSFVDDPVANMLTSAVEANNVFESICYLLASEPDHTSWLAACRLQTLQDLVSVAIESIGYSSEVISTQLALLECHGSTADDSAVFDPRIAFIGDEYLLRTVFETALARFPYESLPFLQLCQSLANADVFDDQGLCLQYISFRLKTLSSFTQTAETGLSSYQTIREDENANLVQLQRPLSMLGIGYQRSIANGKARSSEGDDLVIWEEAIGEVISETVPAIVRWRHQYSGLTLLGSWLELHYTSRLQEVLSLDEDAYDVATEIVALFATIINNSSTIAHSHLVDDIVRQQIDFLIEQTSIGLQHSEDIVRLVADTLEQQLQLFRRKTAVTFPTRLIIACLEFLNSLAAHRSKDIWSAIITSSLLDSGAGIGLLLAVVEGAEVPNQEFAFLLKCCKTYSVLTDTVFLLPNPVSASRAGASRPSTGLAANSPAIKSHVASFQAYTQAMLAFFEAISHWAFKAEEQRSQILTSLASTFERILQYSFSVEAEQRTSMNFIAIFRPSAKLIASTLAASISTGLHPNSLVAAVALTSSDVLQHESDFKSQLCGATAGLLTLCNTLLKCNATDTTSFAAQLIYQLPLLVRFVARRGKVSDLAMETIDTLLQTRSGASTTPLLGNLGSVSAISFLNCLEQILVAPATNQIGTFAWGLLKALIGASQQWLAVVILTGSIPASSAQQLTDQVRRPALRHKSFLHVAIDKLLHWTELSETQSISIIEFLIEATAYWSWASDSLASHSELFPVLFSYAGKLEEVGGDDVLSRGYKLMSLVTDLASLNMHFLRAKRDRANLKTYFPLITWLASNALEVSSYNTSLHSNLRKNFSSKYPGLQTSDFQRSAAFKGTYGEEYFYDLEIADKVMAFDPYWTNEKKDASQSFGAEFRRANLNLSIVDAELKLLHSFRALCIDHCVFFSEDREVQKVMARIVETCLRANTNLYPSEAIFTSLFQQRADLAAVLLRQLVNINARGSDFLGLLSPAWDCIRSGNSSWDLAINNYDMVYWRSLLSMLALSFQFHVRKKSKPPPTTAHAVMLIDPANSTAVEVTSVVICDGLKTITNALHDQHRRNQGQGYGNADSAVGRADVSLILSLFQTILRLPSLPQFADQLSAVLISSGVGHACLTLYSWAHILVAPENDSEPIYADVCLQLLVSMSSLPKVAEDLAVEGVLSRVLTARVTQTLQSIPNGASHLDRRPPARYFYRLWSLGLIPLCLNLLHNVGVAVAAEVSTFLNLFPQQLRRANMAFAPIPARSANESDQITLTAATECSTLALISFILDSYRTAGASAGVDSASIMPLEGYDEDKKVLAEDVQDLVKAGEAGVKGRIVVEDDKELALQKSRDGDLLVKKVFAQLEQGLACLKGRQEEEE